MSKIRSFLPLYPLPRWWRLCLVLSALILGATWVAVVQAQESTPTSAPASEVSADEVNAVASELWCPLCSGVRLDACELKACEQMKEMIAIKLADGEDTDSIRTYFVEQYGPQVLGEPPWEGFNWLAWVLPFVVLAIGGYFLWHTVRRMVRPAPVTVTTTDTTPASATGAPTNGSNRLDDEYERKLAEELKRYG